MAFPYTCWTPITENTEGVSVKASFMFNCVATSPSTQPPLGLRPRIVWLEARKQEIREAMERYVNGRMDVPYAWAEELLELETQIKNWKGEEEWS